MNHVQLSRLVDMENPDCVMDEVRTIVSLMCPDFDPAALNRVFADIVRLFKGEYSGYAPCMTDYHDLKHTTDTMLAMARLMHGAVVAGEVLNCNELEQGLIAALMHDTGYIKTTDEARDADTPLPLMEIRRSISFMKAYLSDNGFDQKRFTHLPTILRCTDLSTSTSKLSFAARQVELLCKMLGTADLLGQIADRTYLEKLLFLFSEFKQGQVTHYDNELDLLKKTSGFFAMSRKRLADELGGVSQYMRFHFKARWNLDRNLYMEALDAHTTYLTHILTHHENGGIVKKLNKENC